MPNRVVARHRRRAERAAAAAGEGRVWPWWARLGSDMTAPASPSWTTLGTLSSPSRATVDPRGMVTPDGSWSLEWWVGAGGAWHLPGRETSVRQHLVGSTPVVETVMRVPGGDVAATVFAVAGSGRQAAVVVVDIENRSPAPVALALAVRPYNPTGVAPVGRIDLLGDRTIAVDGRVGVLLPRPPARALWSAFAAGDVLRLLQSEAPADERRSVSCPDRLAQAAFVYPMAHRTAVRVALPYGEGETPPSSVVASLPGAAAVARSWAAQGRRGLQASLPTGRLADAIEANRGFLLLAAGRQEGDRSARGRRNAAVANALGRWGFGPEAALVSPRSRGGQPPFARARDDRWLAGYPGEGGGDARVAPGDAAVAPADRGVGAGDAGVAPGGVGPGAAVRGTGDPAAARDTARQIAELAQRDIHRADPRALDRLRWLLDAASPSWGWPVGHGADAPWSWPGDGDDGWARACFLAAAGDLLVHERGPGPAGHNGLALCSVLPAEWVGQSLDVHEATTAWGSISFAVRWHGARPALLWELAPAAGIGPVRLVAPGLDPSWSSVDGAGDVLLAPPAE